MNKKLNNNKKEIEDIDKIFKGIEENLNSENIKLSTKENIIELDKNKLESMNININYNNLEDDKDNIEKEKK